MPVLPIPLAFPPLVSGEDLPVRSTDDVLAALPEHVVSVPDAPVRDAIVEGATDMFLAYQVSAAYAAAQSDPTRAAGVYLDGYLDEVGMFRADGELDEAARDRYFAVEEVVTPAAILDLVDALLAPVTTELPQLSDSILDRWYVQNTRDTNPDNTYDDASNSYQLAFWHSFVGDGTVEMDPDYPDRRYALRRQPFPGGPRAWSEGYGREFLLRVPDISGSDDNAAYVADGTSIIVARYVYDGTQTNGDAAFVGAGLNASDALYQRIATAVDAIRGQGVRWLMIVDPRL